MFPSSNIWGQIRKDTTGRPGYLHHDLIMIYHTVTVSWYWANQSLPYPNNAECLARKRQVSIEKAIQTFCKGSLCSTDSNPTPYGLLHKWFVKFTTDMFNTYIMQIKSMGLCGRESLSVWLALKWVGECMVTAAVSRWVYDDIRKLSVNRWMYSDIRILGLFVGECMATLLHCGC